MCYLKSDKLKTRESLLQFLNIEILISTNLGSNFLLEIIIRICKCARKPPMLPEDHPRYVLILANQIAVHIFFDCPETAVKKCPTLSHIRAK